MRRKLPLTAQEAAVYAPRLEDLTAQRTRRTDAVAWGAELKQLRAAGLSGCDGLAGGRLRRRARARGGRSRPGAQAVAHGAPEAFSAHSQAQLWRRDATSRPMPQLSPEDCLASSPVVSMWMSCAESRPRQHRAGGAPASGSRSLHGGCAPTAELPPMTYVRAAPSLCRAQRPRRALGGPGSFLAHRRLRWAQKMPAKSAPKPRQNPQRPASRRLMRSGGVQQCPADGQTPGRGSAPLNAPPARFWRRKSRFGASGNEMSFLPFLGASHNRSRSTAS